MARKRKTTANKRVVYRYRPAPKRRTAARNVRRRDENIDLKKVVRGSVSVAIGMVIAKAAVNKLTEGGDEQTRWSWPNIAMAAASSIIAAFILGAVFKLKKPTIGLIAAGGVSLAMYKAFTCKLAPKWGWSESWFGADDEIHPDFLGAGQDGSEAIEVVDYEPADVGEASSYWGQSTDSGGQVVNYNPAMGYDPNMGAVETNAGGQVVPWVPSMGAAEAPGSIGDLRQVSARVAQSYPGSY